MSGRTGRSEERDAEPTRLRRTLMAGFNQAMSAETTFGGPLVLPKRTLVDLSDAGELGSRTDAGYESQKRTKSCCLARTLYLPAKDVDSIIKDIGLVERGQVA